MLVLHRFVMMQVLVVFGQVKPYSESHQNCREDKSNRGVHASGNNGPTMPHATIEPASQGASARFSDASRAALRPAGELKRQIDSQTDS